MSIVSGTTLDIVALLGSSFTSLPKGAALASHGPRVAEDVNVHTIAALNVGCAPITELDFAALVVESMSPGMHSAQTETLEPDGLLTAASKPFKGEQHPSHSQEVVEARPAPRGAAQRGVITNRGGSHHVELREANNSGRPPSAEICRLSTDPPRSKS